MPDRDVDTIGDLIYYQHAKIIVKSAFGVPDGGEEKGGHYGFVKGKFRGLGGGARDAAGSRRGKSFLDFSRTSPLPHPDHL